MRSRRPCSRTRSPASPPGTPASSGTWWVSTGWARRRLCGRMAPTSWCRTWQSCYETCCAVKGSFGMIANAPYGVEPWCLTEASLDLNLLAQSESIFALSNGHIGLRGNLDEGEPHGLPGSYLNSVYELRPLPYAEVAYGNPESGQTVINVTNGKLIRLLVNDEPFDLRYGERQTHERELDLHAGVLRRAVRWTSPAGQTVQVSSVRLVSLTQRAVVAIRYEVEVLDTPARVVVQSELVANETLPTQSDDPRVGAAL